MRFYVYKMTTDNGGAPCVTETLLTLAICKPMIRSAAQVEDDAWLVGIGGKDLDGRLIYIAQVTNKLNAGEYYRLPQYRKRMDCIYEWGGNALSWREGSELHKNGDEAIRDIGLAPDYKKANVLLSDNFRYLGNAGFVPDQQKYPHLGAKLKEMRSGHRVNHTNELLCELMALQRSVWEKYPNIMKIGKPSDPAPMQNKCHC